MFWHVRITGTQSAFVSCPRVTTILTSNSIDQFCLLLSFLHMESYRKSVSLCAWLPLLNIVIVRFTHVIDIEYLCRLYIFIGV